MALIWRLGWLVGGMVVLWSEFVYRCNSLLLLVFETCSLFLTCIDLITSSSIVVIQEFMHEFQRHSIG